MDAEDTTVATFLDDLAAGTTPAGGSAAAVTGAMGAALCEMVAAQSGAGEDGGDPELDDAAETLRDRRGSLQALAEADATAVEALFLADAPTDADRERAVAVPQSIAEACLAVLEAAAVVADRAEGTVAVDAATGAVLARAGLRAAAVTVRANLDPDDDPAAGDRVAAVETAGEEALQAVLAGVGVEA